MKPEQAFERLSGLDECWVVVAAEYGRVWDRAVGEATGEPSPVVRRRKTAPAIPTPITGVTGGAARAGAAVPPRLKLAGCWWQETHAHARLNRRVARAIPLWDSYRANN